ncbi:ribonuclease HIII [Metabacillus sp. GX 13764]|uniref:ribonuclease HIII n=1 Tax=Metabacillus kandeliae TaxID=2900151 RepID=UPI001E641B47|nr:ribonuclease HIII [Metabacillus kandeliae]MCD7032832.1 ribonuclease HIII [Metabacillus kandeliae]
MSHSVIQTTPAAIQKMKLHYKDSLIEKLPQGALFAAKTANCSITAYKSGKVLFQGAGAQTESGRWQSDSTGGNTKPINKKSSAIPAVFSPPPSISEMSVIGSDEVGTGDYFGPMTVAAAYASRKNLPLLKELGVKDSKNLTDSQITAIAKDLIKTIPYSLLILPNEKYNVMQAKGMSQGKLKALLHNQAITKLKEKISPEEPEAVLIDQFAVPDIYFRHLSGKAFTKEKTYFSTKAEGVHLAVAAASIIARYAFLKEFDKLSKKAGFPLPKGAGSKVDEAAAKLMAAQGEQTAGQFVKLHFANTGKAKLLLAKKQNRQ